MKNRRILIGAAVIGFLFSACASAPKTTVETPTKMESYKILIQYAKMDENKMVYLDISEKEAEQLGVPAEHYRDGLFDIQCANEAIQQMKENGEPVDHLKLPEYPADAQ